MELATISNNLKSITGKFNLQPVTSRLQQLRLFQALYLVALIMQFSFIFGGDLSYDQLLNVGLLALAAMAVELWPKVVATWETLLGRVIIILTYAIIGNFAVAFASLKLNEIVGIDPSPLFYSISFVTLLMAPMWILTITLLAMAFYMVFIQFAVLFRVIMRLLRIAHDKDGKDIKYPITTAIVRLILAPSMFFVLVMALNSYSGDLSTISFSSGKGENKQSIPSQELLEELKQSFQTNAEIQVSDLNTVANTESDDNAPQVEQLRDHLEQEEADSNNMKGLNKLIAAFVHHVELYPKIQCIKSNEEHALYVGENDILVSKPNPDSPTGYDFSVRTCTLKSY